MNPIYVWIRTKSDFYPMELHAGMKPHVLIRMVEPNTLYEILFLRSPGAKWVPVEGPLEAAMLAIQASLPIRENRHIPVREKEQWQ